MQERASGGGKPDAGDFVHPAPAKTLVDGIMFAVDREQGPALAARFGGDKLTRYHQTFLVGEAHGFARADCFVGGLESGDPDDGADDEIDLGVGGDTDGAGRAVEDFGVSEPGGAELGAEDVGIGFVRDGDDLGLPAQGLLVHGFKVVAGAEGRDLEAVGVGFDNVECAAANRAGGTQNGEALHLDWCHSILREFEALRWMYQ